MKTYTTNVLCFKLKLYKIGILIGLIYMAFNIFLIHTMFLFDLYDYTLSIICPVTIITSIILIKGLIQNRYLLLLPWMFNALVCIYLNLSLVQSQFKEANKNVTAESFNAAFVFLIGLEAQLFCFYIINNLMTIGEDKYCKAVFLVPPPTIIETFQNIICKLKLTGSEQLDGGDKLSV